VTLWQSDGTPQDLGVDGKGQGINSQGEVVGYADNTTPQAFLWSQGIITQLGTLSGFDSSIATAINDADEVVGIAYVFANPNNEVGFKWTASTGMQAIEGSATASGVNSAGDVAGMTSDLRAAIFTATGTTIGLGTLGDFSLAGAVNNQGHACGMSPLVAGGPAHAFFYNGTTMQDIGTLQAGSVTVAPSINDSDLIVGSSNLADHALPYVWSATTGMEDLNGLISNESGWSGWLLVTASGIDSVGEISGAGQIVSGEIHGFLLKPE
jgi:probable HAF family extracellular repeat protein